MQLIAAKHAFVVAIVAAALVLGVLAPGPQGAVARASGVPGHDHAQGHDLHGPLDGDSVAVHSTGGTGPGGRFEQLTENLDFLAHVPFEQGTDMQFQRRDRPHRRRGRVVPGPRDYAFLGTDASAFGSAGRTAPADDVAVRVVDVTDPAAPQVLADITCPGFKSDIAIHEDLLLQAIERDAPFYGFEGASTNRGCAPAYDPHGVDVPGAAGVRVFDISDPAKPVLVRFVDAAEFGGGGVHNVSVVPWAGLAYLATFTLFGPDPRFVYLDLNDPAIPATVLPLRSISPTAVNECHDLAVDPARQLAFCGAFEQGLIWDIADPRRPKGLATMTNDGVFHYHGMRLAPDGRTLVIGAEQTGPDEVAVSKEVGVGGNSCVGASRSGALWFYDLADPRAPTLLGTFAPATPMPDKGFCTSHFYNFVPGSDRLVTSWMEGGAFVVDYGSLPGLRGNGAPAPLTAAAQEQAWFLPVGASFWSAYYWHGHLYGLAYGGEPGGGLWIMRMDGLADAEPAAQDEGTSWARWTRTPAR
jgi:hypothetical protein